MKWATIKAKALPVAKKLTPYAAAVERAATIAVHLQKPTVVGIAGVSGALLGSLVNHFGARARGVSWHFCSPLGAAHTASALLAAGATTIKNDGTCVASGGLIPPTLLLVPDSSIKVAVIGNRINVFDSEVTPVEWLRAALDGWLHPRLVCSTQLVNGNYELVMHPDDTPILSSEEGLSIVGATQPLMAPSRCILLSGRPGTGKSTLAQFIASQVSTKRVVTADCSLFEHGTGLSIEHTILVDADVLIVDDIDKLDNFNTAKLDSIRSTKRFKLIVLTANNGEHDNVIDGALIRPGRIDEVFEIKPTKVFKSEAFKSLSDAQWDEISQWPVAFRNEVALRLERRPGSLRLEDLRERVGRRVKSREVLT